MSKAMLVILDGYGITEDPSVSAISKAHTPYIDGLFEQHPNSTLFASGENVGLPEGQFGNSEVGHLNIGAGRIVWQELSRINKSIDDGSFYENETLLEAVSKAKQKGYIHLMGLFSDGGVHSHYEHLFALLKLCKQHGIESVYIHALTDGRDTSPNGGLEYVKTFEQKAKEIGVGEIVSVVGRYYAMDRDNRWERTQLAYDLLVHGKGEPFSTAGKAIQASYDNGVTDEFIKPALINTDSQSRLSKDDVLLFFNIRGDRARQISRAFTEPDFEHFPTDELKLNYYTFTSYDDTLKNVQVAYPPVDIKNTIGQVVSKSGKKQLRIAETEKYPHVTYFFNGGDEVAFEGEERIMIPSPKVATYDLQPEMSAAEVAEKLMAEIKTERFDFIVLNFANPDMVGHTGSMEAAIEAVETIDKELKRVLDAAIAHNYSSIVIADHGNADIMVKEDGSAHTAHTTSKVPFIVVNVENLEHAKDGILADIAPSLLKLMEIPQPDEMTGRPLL